MLNKLNMSTSSFSRSIYKKKKQTNKQTKKKTIFDSINLYFMPLDVTFVAS